MGLSPGPRCNCCRRKGETVAVGAADIAAGSESDGGSDTAEPGAADLTPVRYSPDLVAAPFDPAVGAALAGAGTDPVSPSYLDPSLDVPLQHDSEVARRQDALGALMWRALQPRIEPRTEILMPPMVWSPRPEDAQAILTAVATTINAGMARPRPLTEVIADGNAVPPQNARRRRPSRTSGIRADGSTTPSSPESRR